MAKQDNPASTQMHERVSGLEKWLDGVYKNVPSLPEGVRKWLANNVWWLALIGGILGLLSAFGLWQAVQVANNLVYNLGTYSAAYGAQYRPLIWISLVVTVVQSVLLLMAYNGLKAHRKSGWNLLFYTSLLSVVTIIAYLLTASYGFSNAIGSLIGMAISFYFLFQIRSYFTEKA